MFEKISSTFYKFCKDNILYVFAFLAVASLSIAYACFESESLWRDIFKSVGFTLISGGVFAVILKSQQFSNIFQDELRKIIYSDEHLEKRVDLDTLWEKVTKALSRQKFSAISKKMHDNIKKYYLPLEHDFYYSDYKIKIDIQFDPNDENYILVNEQNSTHIIAEDSASEICYKFLNNITFDEKNPDLTTYELDAFKLNGKKVDPSGKLKVSKSATSLIVNFEIKLSGKTKYSVSRNEKKRYRLDLNNKRRQLAVWVYSNCSLDLHYPTNMDVEFIDFGVLNNWKVENTSTGTYKRIEAEYNGLIYKNQGYMLYLSKNILN